MICHYSPLFATVRHYSHYSRLFALFILFVIWEYLLLVIHNYLLSGFSRHPECNPLLLFVYRDERLIVPALIIQNLNEGRIFLNENHAHLS